MVSHASMSGLECPGAVMLRTGNAPSRDGPLGPWLLGAATVAALDVGRNPASEGIASGIVTGLAQRVGGAHVADIHRRCCNGSFALHHRLDWFR
jgi:hypothetical protein